MDKKLGGPYQDQYVRLATGQFSKHYSSLLTTCNRLNTILENVFFITVDWKWDHRGSAVTTVIKYYINVHLPESLEI